MTRIDSVYVLHPVPREYVKSIQAELVREKIPLHPYETGRGPLRQQALYLQGRDKDHLGPDVTPDRPFGRTCTFSQAWHSAHQYLCAVDMVFSVDGKWTWAEPERGMWAKYHEIALKNGMTPLYNRKGDLIEEPHIQLRGVAIDALRRGEYPAGGDRDWEDALTGFIAEWGDRPGAPPAPHGRPGIG